MEKIAIVTRRVISGGIEVALISMLEKMDRNKFDITLFLMSEGGEFEDYIPNWIKKVPIYGKEDSLIKKVINKVKNGELIKAFKICFYFLKAKNAGNGYLYDKYLSKTIDKIDEEFDIAIAYHTPASFPVIYVCDFLKAKKRIAWIHSDVEEYKNELAPYMGYYNKFDNIYCVSKYAMYKFNRQYPELSSKTKLFYNIINKEKIYKLSKDFKPYNDDFKGIRILTVGRLTKQKGQDIIPNIIKTLKDNNLKFKWYLIGDGELYSYVNKKIKGENIEEELILLGRKNNPYPYFKDCDIYVQPSRHEGYCLTLAEAKLFNKPIVTTNFVGANEQIVHFKNGIIVEFDEKDIAYSIEKLIKDKNIRDKFSNALYKENLSNTMEE